MKTIREEWGNGYDIKNNKDNLSCFVAPGGELASECDTIESLLRNGEVQTIILNCWELIGKDHRLREKVLYSVFQWFNRYKATVILFAQKSSVIPEKGKMQRGGFGRLAAIADLVIDNSGRSEKTTEKKDMVAAITNIEQPASVPEVMPAITVVEKEVALGTPPKLQMEVLDEVDEIADFDSFDDEDDDENEGSAELIISASGNKEFATRYSDSIANDKEIVAKWDALNIARTASRVYFFSKPKEGSTYAALAGARIEGSRIHWEQRDISTVDYELPQELPLEDSPEVGITIEEYLARYRKAISANVNNEVIENNEDTGELLKVNYPTNIRYLKAA